MKKSLLVLIAGIAMLVAVAVAQVKDWHDLDGVHEHVKEAINEMQRAREANHYDMEGHGAKAEQLLHQAEHELQLSIDAAKKEGMKK